MTLKFIARTLLAVAFVALREIAITKVPFIIERLFVTKAAYEDEHVGAQWCDDGDGEFDRQSG